MGKRANRAVRLLAVGDIALPAGATTRGVLVHESMQGVIKQADIVVANLESPCRGGEPALGKINLYMEENAVQRIKDMGIGAVSLANNHVLDYGSEGAERTVALLKHAGVGYFGLVESETPQTPLIVHVRGLELGFLGYVSPAVGTVFATGCSIGPARLSVESVLHEVKQLKGNCDYVLVSLHWGLEHQYFPTPKQVEVARRIVDAGADVVLGHHAHVFQGVECYRHGCIFYGLGNFTFPDYEVASFYNATGGHAVKRGSWSYWGQHSLAPLVELPGRPSPARISEVFFTRLEPGTDELKVLCGPSAAKLRRRLSILTAPLSWASYRACWQVLKRYCHLVAAANVLKKKGGLRSIPTASNLREAIRRVIGGRSDEGNGV